MPSTAEFFNVQPVEAALDTLLQRWTPQTPDEMLDTPLAAGRVLAEAPRSPTNLPNFRRSTVDGYAVRAADTFGASQGLPAYLMCVGSLSMGMETALDLQPGQTALIHTGGMLPDSADAVVMIERTQRFGQDEIEVLSPVAPGENVVQIGEDVAQGAVILPAGHRLRPQDIGGLLAVGITSVCVVVKPRVGILSSGDELVTPEQTPAPGQIRDINSDILAALVSEAGGEALLLGIARDELSDFQARARAGFERCDLLVITAGSSVSARDLTREVIERLGEPGILQHGLAVKPGKPTITAICAGKPVIGLPGNPASAYMVAMQIVIPLIRRFLGEEARPRATVRAKLNGSIASTTGREDTIPIRLTEQDGEMLAEPVFGKSNLIYTLVNADGLLVIPLNTTGLKAGTMVEVSLF